MVKIIMHGCCGHMGQVISQIVKEDADAQIVAGIDPFDNGKNGIPGIQKPGGLQRRSRCCN